MPVQPIRRTRAYEQIVNQLAELIRQGSLKPGDRLPPERELASAFGVGRPTLRQAITVLAEAGIVEVKPGSGIYLRQPVDAWGSPNNPMAMLLLTEQRNFVHILELRVAIECEAAYLAAQRRTAEHVEQLRKAYADLEKAFTERHEAAREDFLFHWAVAEATGNPVFVKVMTSLADMIMQAFVEQNRTFYREAGRIEANLHEHRAIMEAIIDGRPDDARQAMSFHLRRVLERLEQLDQNNA